MPEKAPPLRAVTGGRTTARPRAGARRTLASDEQVTCWNCEPLGIATSAVVKVTLAPRRTPQGRKTGGTDVWACAHCLARGEITELIRG